MTHEECEHCGKSYLLVRDRDEGRVYQGSPEANHLLSVCPHCGRQNITFMDLETLGAVLRSANLTAGVGMMAPAELAALARETWGVAVRRHLQEVADARLPAGAMAGLHQEITAALARES